MPKQSIGKQILHFPLTKIIIGLFLCGFAAGMGQYLTKMALAQTSMSDDVKNLASGISSAVIVMLVYIVLYGIYENRKVSEFSRKGLVRNISIGIILGFVLQSLTILVIYIKGGYTVQSVNPISYILPPLTMAFTSAIIEEILLRGIVFRITEEKLGSYLALLISAVLFGAMHLGNPNSSLVAGVGLAIQAGLLLGVAYMYTRDLWFAIAIHFAWNFTQSAIYGAKVSGTSIPKTLINSKIEGATWYTGGAFGPEGSIQATLFCFVAMLVLLILSKKEGKVVKPYWVK